MQIKYFVDTTHLKKYMYFIYLFSYELCFLFLFIYLILQNYGLITTTFRGTATFSEKNPTQFLRFCVLKRLCPQRTAQSSNIEIYLMAPNHDFGFKKRLVS